MNGDSCVSFQPLILKAVHFQTLCWRMSRCVGKRTLLNKMKIDIVSRVGITLFIASVFVLLFTHLIEPEEDR